MRKITLLLIVILCFMVDVSSYSQSQSNNMYQSKLNAAIETLMIAKTNQDYEACFNAFSRIAQVETKEWLPLYYAAYSKIKSAYIIKDKKEQENKASESETYIQKAADISKNNSEIYCIKGMIANVRLMIDPATGGMKYGKQMDDFYTMAIKLNPKNPRAYYLRAVSIYYTPAQWGGGHDKAKPYFEKAKVYFEDKVALPMPQWGKADNDYFLTICK